MSDKLNMKNGLTYIGAEGAVYTGVKSRDLSAAEIEALGPRERRIVRLSGAWREPTKSEIKAAEKQAEQQAETSADSGQEG